MQQSTGDLWWAKCLDEILLSGMLHCRKGSTKWKWNIDSIWLMQSCDSSMCCSKSSFQFQFQFQFRFDAERIACLKRSDDRAWTKLDLIAFDGRNVKMKMRSHGNRVEAALKIESRELFLSFRRRRARVSGTVLKRRQSCRRNQLACLKSMGLI